MTVADMFAPEEQQIEICLLKSNLEAIENDLIVQRSALPALDAENDQKYRATMEAVRIARSLNAEIDRYKQENLRLTAKRMQLKQQCENITAELERARQTRGDLQLLLTDEESSTELEIRNYEDTLREKADRFRQTRGFYNEIEIARETDKMNDSISHLQINAEELENDIDMLKNGLEIYPEVPDNLLYILGKDDMNEKLNELNKTIEQLHEEKVSLIN